MFPLLLLQRFMEKAMMLNKNRYLVVSVFCLIGINAHAEQSKTIDVLETQQQIQNSAIQSQKKIEQLDDATNKLLKEYRTVVRETESINAYNQQLQKLVDSQQQLLTSLQQQLDELNVTEREIVPFMLRMLDTLEQFIALDVPFLREERQTRISQLRQLMDNADASLAEKYRRLMEAYLIETDYGNNLENAQGQLSANDLRIVEFLRLGRLELYYLTLDGQQAGKWDRQTQAWQTLDNKYIPAIQQGIRIARKQMAPQLLDLPVNGG